MAERLDALDGWRTAGAFMVIAAHLQGFSAIRLTADPGAAAYGVLGVQYFFGISGFVISRGLLRPGGDGLRSFYVRRFFRIWPPLILYICVVVALALMGLVERPAVGVLRGLTFTCNLRDADCGGWLGDHFWSLSIEEQFYLLIPLLLRFVRPRWPISLLMLAFGPLVVALLAVGPKIAADLLSGFTVIALGVFCGLHEQTVSAWARRAPQWLAAIAVVATVVIAELPPSRWTTMLSDLVMAPLILFVLMTTAFGGGWMSRLFASRIVVSLGAVSYSIYLWQQLATRDWPGAGPLFYLGSVGACVVFAYLSRRWFEGPLIALGRRLSRRIDSGRTATPRPGAEITSANLES